VPKKFEGLSREQQPGSFLFSDQPIRTTGVKWNAGPADWNSSCHFRSWTMSNRKRLPKEMKDHLAKAFYPA